MIGVVGRTARHRNDAPGRRLDGYHSTQFVGEEPLRHHLDFHIQIGSQITTRLGCRIIFSVFKGADDPVAIILQLITHTPLPHQDGFIVALQPGQSHVVAHLIEEVRPAQDRTVHLSDITQDMRGRPVRISSDRTLLQEETRLESEHALLELHKFLDRQRGFEDRRTIPAILYDRRHQPLTKFRSIDPQDRQQTGRINPFELVGQDHQFTRQRVLQDRLPLPVKDDTPVRIHDASVHGVVHRLHLVLRRKDLKYK